MAVIEAIRTTLLEADSTSAGIEFTSIPQTYERLQLRCSLRITSGTAGSDVSVKLNNVTSTVSAHQSFHGSNSSISGWASAYQSNGNPGGDCTGYSNDKAHFNCFIMDLDNYADTNKNTTMNVYWSKSVPSSPSVGRRGSVHAQTTAITSIAVYTNGYNFARGSLVSLYGIKSS